MIGRPTDYLIIGMVALGAALFVRGAKSADRHPAMTATHPPGWQLQRALPGEDYKPRGPYFDNRQGCLLDLASDRNAMPSGTRLLCIRIEAPSERKAQR